MRKLISLSTFSTHAHFDELNDKYRLCTTKQWNFNEARNFAKGAEWRQYVQQVSYRPFDRQWSVFHKHVLTILRRRVMSQLIQKERNVCLISSRAVNDQEFAHCFVASEPVDKIFISSKTSTNAYVFPLFFGNESFLGSQRRPNFSRQFLGSLANRLRILPDSASGLLGDLKPEPIFNYIYAVMHSPTYRTRYAEFLKIDFPRIPLPRGYEIFEALAEKGGELVALHLMESPKLDDFITAYAGPAAPTVEKVSYANETVWLDKAQTIGFRGVPQATWAFHIGGYQVCEKWLKDRKGRALSADDLRHYQRVVVALNETRRLMAEIDAVIEQHGGFPAAFAASPAPSPNLSPEGRGEEPAEASAQPTLLDVTGTPAQASLFEVDDASGRSAPSAPTAKTADDEPAPPDITAFGKDDLMAAIRDAFDEANALSRDDLIRQTAYVLGYQRAGRRIADVLDDAVRTAVKRGLVEHDDDLLRLYRGSIDTWDRDWLKREFLAAIGRAWIEREDAIRAFARWLGYRRTSALFDETTRSLITGLLREGRLEADKNAIRRVP